MKIEGLAQLDAVLKAKAAAMQAAATAAVALEVKSIQADAEREAPRGKTGDLVAGIEGDAHGTSGEVRATARHSPFVEFGTSKMAAQPYMGPAADKSRGRFVGRVSAGIRKAVT